jgi:hypothetical protein
MSNYDMEQVRSTARAQLDMSLREEIRALQP